MIKCITRITGIVFDENAHKPLEWYYKNLHELKNERLQTLFRALEPIQWDWDSSIRYRQNLVTERQNTIETLLPFLNNAEKRLVEQWKEENHNSGLWE